MQKFMNSNFSSQFVNPVLTFSVAMLLCGVVMFSHAFITTSTHFLILTALFGILNGSQNVLIAVTPTIVFGRENLSVVFGYILFLGGIGALIGAPIAGENIATCISCPTSCVSVTFIPYYGT